MANRDDHGSPCFRTWHEVAKQGDWHPPGVSLVMRRADERYRRFIQRVFSYRPAEAAPEYYPPPGRLIRVPEGEAHLIYVDSAVPFSPRADSKALLETPRVFVHAGHDQAVGVMPFGVGHWVGLVLEPGVLAALVDTPGQVLNGGCFDLAQLAPDATESLYSALTGAPDDAARLTRLVAFVMDRLQERGAPEDRFMAACTSIHACGGRHRIDTIAGELGVSTRTLERDFVRLLGMSPKRYARVVRLGELLRRLDAPDTWSATAHDCGFVDQSHMISECQELLTCTPMQLPTGRVLRSSLVTWTVPIAEPLLGVDG